MSRKRIEQVFLQSDNGSKGFLNISDIKVASVALLGYKPSKVEVEQLVSRFGSTYDNDQLGLNLTEFKLAMSTQLAKVDEDEEIRSAFLAFDKTCRGFLVLDDVKSAFKQVLPHFSDHRIEAAFREVDRDGDGRISYKDFDFMMKFDSFS